jgi:hypothetical protein
VTSAAAQALCAVLLVGAVVSAVRLVVRPDGPTYLGGRSSDTAHLLMNASMGAMLVVPAAVLPLPAVLVLYASIGVVFAGLVVLGLARPTPARRLHRPAHVYHVVAASAMAWAVHLMAPAMVGMPTTPGPPHDMAGMSDAPGMSDMPGMSGMDPSAHHHLAASAPVAAWVLAALFALDAMGTLALLRQVTDRVAVVPHVIMDLGMVCMLLPAWLLLPA